MDAIQDQINAIYETRYKIQHQLGAGGMGVVYQATDNKFQRQVAIKVLQDRLIQYNRSVERFRNEVRCIASLSHPNTLRLFDGGVLSGGAIYMITEFLNGVPLDALYKSKQYTHMELLQYVSQVCGALQEAHDLGIIHRDLKPDNVFIQNLGSQKIAKILDFGVAKLLFEDQHITTTNGAVGSPRYMSPEQALNTKVTAKTDMYGMGVMLWEGLTGQRLYPQTTRQGMLSAHVHRRAPKISEHGNFHPGLVQLVASMLSKQPKYRPDSMMQIKMEIDDIIWDLNKQTHSGELVLRSKRLTVWPMFWYKFAVLQSTILLSFFLLFYFLPKTARTAHNPESIVLLSQTPDSGKLDTLLTTSITKEPPLPEIPSVKSKRPKPKRFKMKKRRVKQRQNKPLTMPGFFDIPTDS